MYASTGRLPLPPPQSVAKHADRLGTAIEVASVVTEKGGDEGSLKYVE